MKFEAFSRKKFPADLPITRSAGQEAVDTAAFFSGKCIDDVRLDDLNGKYRHDPSGCISLLTPEAFAFFLPAFMRISIEQYADANAIPDVLINRLLHIAAGDDEERRDAIVRWYGAEQMREVALFLKAMSDKYWRHYNPDDARRALDLFWGRFLQ